MRLGVLPVVLAVPFLVTACVSRSSDDQPSTSWPTDEVQDVRVFDRAALEGDDGIKKIVVEVYKIENVESVSCPADQEVKQGNKFECTVKIGGDDPKDLKVIITVTNEENAEYQVGLPE